MIEPREEPLAGRPVADASGPWWREGVVYQIYPRSFADRNGDGVGDLPGIIDHLDHLGPGGLAVDAIWLSPIYPSPGLDVGYDVSDHAVVDPLFGTEADFARLVADAHARGIRVILDLVMNHTSDQHAWFQASRASRSGPHADWYLWRDPAGFDPTGQPLPPNNWVSFFGGPAWTWEPQRGQFYMHTFLTEQPDLNWRNPAVETAQLAMVRAWLERGVDGFRLDVFNVFLKDAELRPNPEREGATAWDRQVHVHDRDQPDFAALIGRFRALVDEYPDRFTVGELFDGGPDRAAALTTDAHLVFDWELVGARWSADAFRRVIDRREREFGPGRWPTIVLSNHDQPRHASRLAASAETADVDGHREGRGVRSPRPPRHAIHVLRRGDRDGRRRDPRRRDRRPAGSTSPAPTSPGGTATRAGRRWPGPASRGRASRPAGRGSGSGPITCAGTWRPRPPIPPRSSPAIAGSSLPGGGAPPSAAARSPGSPSTSPTCWPGSGAKATTRTWSS